MLQSIHELIVVLSNVKDGHTRSETDNYQSSDVKDQTHTQYSIMPHRSNMYIVCSLIPIMCTHKYRCLS